MIRLISVNYAVSKLLAEWKDTSKVTINDTVNYIFGAQNRHIVLIILFNFVRI